MLVAFERSSNSSTTNSSAPSNSNNDTFSLDHDRRIGQSGGFERQKMPCFSIYGTSASVNNSTELNGGCVGRVPVEDQSEDSSSSTSSIGRNSDDNESSAGRSSGGGGGDGEEVQSEFKGGAMDNLDELEQVLPIKRSISQFYCGKSKSFASLADAEAFSSLNEIVKPENAYSRKRKNMLAYSVFWDKSRNSVRRSTSGGISKKSSGSKSTLALAAYIGCTESTNNSDSSNSNSPSPGNCLPPLPPQGRRFPDNVSASPPGQTLSPWRSFSLSDLQGAGASPSISGIMVNNRHK